MDYLNLSQNPKYSKLFNKTHILFSSNVLDKRNSKKILVLTDNMRIFVLSGSANTIKCEIPIQHIRQISISPGRDQVIVLHTTRQSKDKKDVLCAFLDENRDNFRGDEDPSRLDKFLNLLQTKLKNSDKPFNIEDFIHIASRIHVSGKRKSYRLKFVCTSFPYHTDYLKFDIKGEIIKYHVSVLYGKQNTIQNTNGLHVLDPAIIQNDELQPPEINSDVH